LHKLLRLFGGEIVDREGSQPLAVPPSLACDGNRYPAFSRNASQGTL